VALLSATPSAAAAPSCLQSVRDRYEPGDEVMVVGYGCVRAPSGSTAGADSLLSGYLHTLPNPCAGVDPSMSCNPHPVCQGEVRHLR